MRLSPPGLGVSVRLRPRDCLLSCVQRCTPSCARATTRWPPSSCRRCLLRQTAASRRMLSSSTGWWVRRGLACGLRHQGRPTCLRVGVIPGGLCCTSVRCVTSSNSRLDIGQVEVWFVVADPDAFSPHEHGLGTPLNLFHVQPAICFLIVEVQALVPLRSLCASLLDWEMRSSLVTLLSASMKKHPSLYRIAHDALTVSS